MSLNNKSFFHELKRRNVLQVGGAYLLAALGLAAGITELVNLFELDLWVARTFTLIAIFGFPVAIVLAWRYELTPDGVLPDDIASARAAGTQPPDRAQATTIILNSGTDQILVFWREGGQSRSAHFTDEFVVGRDPTSDVHVDNPAVSRNHARVWRKLGQWFIEDLQSQNGTWIEKTRISQHQLGNHTEVNLSEHGPSLRFEVPEAGDNQKTATNNT